MEEWEGRSGGPAPGHQRRKSPPGYRVEEQEARRVRRETFQEYLAAYDLGPPPQGFTCSSCTQVERREASCQQCAHPGQGCAHTSRREEVVVEWRCEEEQEHQRRWQEEEKMREDVRRRIRRRFDKEQEGKGRRGRGKGQRCKGKEVLSYMEGVDLPPSDMSHSLS